MDFRRNAKLYESGLHLCIHMIDLYLAARQVGHKRGNTRNKGFQLAMQQCCKTKKNVAPITGP